MNILNKFYELIQQVIRFLYRGFQNRGTPKWMVYNGKPYWNGWFGGTTIFGNTHIEATLLHFPLSPWQYFNMIWQGQSYIILRAFSEAQALAWHWHLQVPVTEQPQLAGTGSRRRCGVLGQRTALHTSRTLRLSSKMSRIGRRTL